MKMTIDGVELPVRKTTGSCGYDMYCPKDITLSRFGFKKIDMGVIMEEGDIPEGHFAMILPRSSMGIKHGLTLANTVGIIDSDYRDTIKMSLSIRKGWFFKVSKNDRILQMIICPYATIPKEQIPTEMRKGGIGSTGA